MVIQLVVVVVAAAAAAAAAAMVLCGTIKQVVQLKVSFRARDVSTIGCVIGNSDS